MENKMQDSNIEKKENKLKWEDVESAIDNLCKEDLKIWISDLLYLPEELDKAREEGRKEGIKLRKMLLVDDDYIMTHPRYISDWSDKYNKHYKCNRCKSKCLIPVIEPLVVICPKCGELDLDEIS